VSETRNVQSSQTAKTKLGKPLLCKSDSESINEPSADIVACLGLNDKHSHRINLKYSTSERPTLKYSLFVRDFI
jgi:hypothetical protein